MKSKRFKLSIVFLLCFVYTGLQAQQAILTAGGNASGTGGTASYSIGQVFYTTNTGLNNSVAQGVQQTYKISVVNEIEEAKGIELVCSAYPNPVSNLLTLKIEEELKSEYHITLYDLAGKLIESNTIKSNETLLDMSNLTPAIYILKVTQNNNEIKIFKIIKN